MWFQEGADGQATAWAGFPKPPHFKIWIHLLTLTICLALIVGQVLGWVREHTHEQGEQVPGLWELTFWSEETVYKQVEKIIVRVTEDDLRCEENKAR